MRNSTAFTSGRIPIRQITGASGVQTVSTDKRAWFDVFTAEATETTSGTVELATDAEAITGSDTSRVTTPSNLPAVFVAYQKNLRNILYPVGIDYNDLYKSGWKPYWMNQQGTGFGWGGEYPNGAGTHAWFETAYIEFDGSANSIGNNNTTGVWNAQGFKLGQACTVNAGWLRIKKHGNPIKTTEPLIVTICPDSGGEPEEDNPLITFTLINGHDMSTAENWPISSSDDYIWYRFAGDSAALSANTQYYLVYEAQGNDATNYFSVATHAAGTYAHGSRWYGNSTVPAAWTNQTTRDVCFMIETTEATQLLQSGGQHHGKLVFNNGSPANLSQFLVNDLKNMYSDEGDFSFNLTTSGAIPASSTLCEITMGDLGANRLRLYTDATPNVCVSLAESDGTVVSITDGATDVSGSANRTIMVRCRAKGDGSDALELLLNGAAEGTQLTAQTLSLDANFADQACVILGGGFEAEPTWDKDFKTSQFAGGNLPSNDGDTAFTTDTAAVEASCFTVQNSKLYQNYAYYNAANENGYYLIDPGTLVDATGYALLVKQQIFKAVNTSKELGCDYLLDGDVNYERLYMHEYYFESIDFKYQHDMMSKPNMEQICAKDDDYYFFLNGKLAIDGTGLHKYPSGTALIRIGDEDTTAGSDADVCYHEILCYDAGPLFPSAADGLVVDEFSFWSADMTDIASLLYNSGTPVSVKEVCGLSKNYVERIRFEMQAQGITDNQDVDATAELLDEMEVFSLTPNTNIMIEGNVLISAPADQQYVIAFTKIDGVGASSAADPASFVMVTGAEASSFESGSFSREVKMLCGLHKIEMWGYSEGANAEYRAARNLQVKEIL